MRCAGALFSWRAHGQLHGRVPRSISAWLSKRAGACLECFEGPVLTGQDRRPLLNELLGRVDDLACRLGVGRVRFSGPPVASSWAGAPEFADIFVQCGYQEVPWLTSLVDLGKTEDQLLAAVDRSVRKGIRKCQSAGITINQCKDFDSYLAHFRRPYARDLSGKEFREKIAERDRKGWKIAGANEIYRYFWAEDGEGTVLATLGTYSYKGVATEIMSDRTSENLRNKLPAQDLLHWQILLTHKRTGDTIFNLAGFSPSPRDAKEEGIRRFKQKWGGQTILVPAFYKGEEAQVTKAARRVRDLFSGSFR